MKLSVNWLKQFVVDLDNDETSKIVGKLSSSLTEVEDHYDVGGALDNIVAGEVIEIADHPKLPNLHIVIVKFNESITHEIVCGADNMKIGNIVAVCLPGGSVYDVKTKEAVKITEKEIGGSKSFGMICSAKELGISDDHSGIYILPNSTPIGTNVSAILKDTIIEIENKGITNRPDCFSHIGIAREIAVQNKFKFKQSPLPQKPIQTTQKDLKIKIEDNEFTKRYSAIVITDVKVKESPLWMQARLLANGIRPINNIVDITNYIMLEVGQPSHAFDYDKLAGNTLIVRQSEEGEKIKTLDGKTRTLESGMLLNCDAAKPIGLAGIMGGENTEISNSTTTIVLQVENFEMYNIRSTSRKLGIRTEASTRFEKGLDPQLVEECLFKATEMILDLAGGEIASEIFDFYPVKEEPVVLTFDLDTVKTFLGIEIEKKEIIELLTRLGIKVDSKDDKSSIVDLTIPSFRRDLKIKEDILEDIIRIWGFDKVPFSLPERTLQPVTLNNRVEVEKRIIKDLSSTGSTQIYSYAFVGEELYKKANLSIKDNLKIRNPLSPELEYMRDTILPSLIEKLEVNFQRLDTVDLFEVSKTALKKTDESGMHLQPKFITGGFLSDFKAIYSETKGKVDYLFRKLGMEGIEYKNLNGSEPFKKARIFHPKKTALIFYKEDQVGIIGFISPKVADNFNITINTVLYEINFDLIAKNTSSDLRYKKIYNLPTVQRNLSFWVDERVEVQEIIDHIKSLNLNYLLDFGISDIYEDPAVKEKKSISIEFKLQSSDKTLTEEEISEVMTTVQNSLESKFKVEIRDSK